jgi:hypothetical protein
VWLSAVHTGGKFVAAVIVETDGKFAIGISTTLVVNERCEPMLNPCVNDTSGKFASGVVDSGYKFATVVVVTGCPP